MKHRSRQQTRASLKHFPHAILKIKLRMPFSLLHLPGHYATSQFKALRALLKPLLSMPLKVSYSKMHEPAILKLLLRSRMQFGKVSWTGRHDSCWQCTPVMCRRQVRIPLSYHSKCANHLRPVAEVLGKVHDTIHVRRGRSLGETQEEGNPFWTVKALIPVIESFGFADEIRKRTSGAASPQLIFYGYEVLDEDPFWIPFTEEELEDLGELSDKANVAKKYMDEVRTRKGLFVQRKLVAAANKQKNLKR